MKVIFMGTPEFAVASLDALVKAGFDIAAVVTAPDKPAGRGQKMNESAVKIYAIENSLKILQPVKLKDPDFISELQSLNAELQVVVAFRMLPEVVWNMPPKGTVNLHASLLPQYRGAAPINWSVINGETETGVTTFLLKHEIDTGDILLAETVAIEDNDTAGTVHDKLMNTGSALLVKTVQAIADGDYEETPQSEYIEGELKHAPKIFKEDCEISWMNPVKKVYDQIRGLSPYPTAYTTFQEKNFKIFKAEMEVKEPGILPGGFLSDGKNHLKFACNDGFICVLEVQMEGKKRMGIEEFLRGIRL
ncbi:methionyl-tRNA formyltransferase [Pedobacter sp. HMF7647]|uniref:Methionyl-tRNA formyltransferase n=1 Tax=Hufsiella arboris TaxID=2695275 RepID=A0A7K1YE30_9SPHI|nr:methionyl-tRNA formyltransferase [Hufsiella arboris]MXV52845.1 methionyl-tRNA formyltransferase [Hufsiella arboris]